MKKIDKTTFPAIQLAFLGYDVDAAVSYDIRKEEDGSLVIGFYNEAGELLKPKPLFTPVKPEDLTDIMASNYHTVAGAYRDLYERYNKLKAEMHQVSVPYIQNFIIQSFKEEKKE